MRPKLFDVETMVEHKSYYFGYDDNEDVSVARWVRHKDGTVYEMVTTYYADGSESETAYGKTPHTEAARMYGRTVYLYPYASAPQRLVWWLRWKLREVLRG